MLNQITISRFPSNGLVVFDINVYLVYSIEKNVTNDLDERSVYFI